MADKSSADALKVCFIHGLFLTTWMMEKAERAIAQDAEGSNQRARLTLGDYAS